MVERSTVGKQEAISASMNGQALGQIGSSLFVSLLQAGNEMTQDREV